jgi:hypothetical protein
MKVCLAKQVCQVKELSPKRACKVAKAVIEVKEQDPSEGGFSSTLEFMKSERSLQGNKGEGCGIVRRCVIIQIGGSNWYNIKLRVLVN